MTERYQKTDVIAPYIGLGKPSFLEALVEYAEAMGYSLNAINHTAWPLTSIDQLRDPAYYSQRLKFLITKAGYRGLSQLVDKSGGR